MKMRTRFLALLSAVCLLCSLVPAALAGSVYDIYFSEPFQVITTQRASVRLGPAVKYPELAMISKNNILTAYMRIPSEEGGNDWFVVDYMGQTACVSTTAAKIYGDVHLSIPENVQAFWIVTNQLASVRSGPASTYKELGQLRKNSYLTAFGRVASHEGGNDWYMVFYEGTFAFVSTRAADPW